MSMKMRDAWQRQLGELRHEPIEMRVRAVLGGRDVVDSTRAVLVWEPRRVVPSFAVPVDDLLAELAPTPSTAMPAGAGAVRREILYPGIPFTVHSTAGDSCTVRAGGEVRDGAAFMPSDPDLAGYVVLDFKAFDAWYEEDEPLVAHPREPFHRVDVRASSRHVRVELGGRLLAESTRPVLVFETHLPTRFYLPREDVRAPLRPSSRITHCAYKGEANYWSLDDSFGTPDGSGLDNGSLDDAGRDLAWTYPAPLREAIPLTGLVAFFDELVDVVVDGVRRERPTSAVAKSIVEEARS